MIKQKIPLLPIRCYTCGLPMYEGYELFLERIKGKKEVTEEEELRTDLKKIGITRYCCFRMILGSKPYVSQEKQ